VLEAERSRRAYVPLLQWRESSVIPLEGDVSASRGQYLKPGFLGPAFFRAQVFSSTDLFKAECFHRQAMLLRGLTLKPPTTMIRT